MGPLAFALALLSVLLVGPPMARVTPMVAPLIMLAPSGIPTFNLLPQNLSLPSFLFPGLPLPSLAKPSLALSTSRRFMRLAAKRVGRRFAELQRGSQPVLASLSRWPQTVADCAQQRSWHLKCVVRLEQQRAHVRALNATCHEGEANRTEQIRGLEAQLEQKTNALQGESKQLSACERQQRDKDGKLALQRQLIDELEAQLSETEDRLRMKRTQLARREKNLRKQEEKLTACQTQVWATEDQLEHQEKQAKELADDVEVCMSQQQDKDYFLRIQAEKIQSQWKKIAELELSVKLYFWLIVVLLLREAWSDSTVQALRWSWTTKDVAAGRPTPFGRTNFEEEALSDADAAARLAEAGDACTLGFQADGCDRLPAKTAEPEAQADCQTASAAMSEEGNCSRELEAEEPSCPSALDDIMGAEMGEPASVAEEGKACVAQSVEPGLPGDSVQGGTGGGVSDGPMPGENSSTSPMTQGKKQRKRARKAEAKKTAKLGRQVEEEQVHQ